MQTVDTSFAKSEWSQTAMFDRVVWKLALRGMIWSSPAVGSDFTIFVGSWDGKVYAINPDGSKKWEFTTGDLVIPSPAIGADGAIYVGNGSGKI